MTKTWKQLVGFDFWIWTHRPTFFLISHCQICGKHKKTIKICLFIITKISAIALNKRKILNLLFHGRMIEVKNTTLHFSFLKREIPLFYQFTIAKNLLFITKNYVKFILQRSWHWCRYLDEKSVSILLMRMWISIQLYSLVISWYSLFVFCYCLLLLLRVLISFMYSQFLSFWGVQCITVLYESGFFPIIF